MRLLIAVLVLACSPAYSQMMRGRPPNFPVAAAQREELIAAVYQHLQDHYVFPERLEAAFPQLRARWSNLDKLDNAHALVDRMNADLRDVFHDGHLNVKLAAGLPPGALDEDDKPDPEKEAFEKRNNYGLVKAELLPGGIGYLNIIAFAGKSRGEEKAYAAAMAFLQNTQALIIDLRQNGGGDGESVADLVGYLLDKKTLLQWDVERGGKQREHFSAENVEGPRYGEKRPVFVLTAKRTFSAAEECAYDLQTQKRAVIVGEATGGGANHNRFFRLAKDFALSVPFMTTRNPVTGTNWQGTGVQPDVKVSADDALKTAQRMAVEKQLVDEQDPRRKERLRQLVAELR
jgi:hypothetical protein